MANRETHRSSHLEPNRRSVCIVSFSPLARDARVLRQIEALARDYEVSVIGFGSDDDLPIMDPAIRWHLLSVPPSDRVVTGGGRGGTASAFARAVNALPWKARELLYQRWYWSRPQYRKAADIVYTRRHDLYIANDWNGLPIACCGKQAFGSPVVFDAHEFGPLEYEHDPEWLATRGPFRSGLLRRYLPCVDASMTVAPLLAERYREDFGLDATVVLNAPSPVPLASHRVSAEHIRLVHHGGASRDRRLEDMIRALSSTDDRFHLDFMLVGSDHRYKEELSRLAGSIAPNRVSFRLPVAPAELVPVLSSYDIGFCLLYPSTYNIAVSLPNKLFDYVVAGLAVCVGPSLSMADFVTEHGVGFVTPSYSPNDVAHTLNSLTVENIETMRQASAHASLTFNADVEMDKVRRICASVLEKVSS